MNIIDNIKTNFDNSKLLLSSLDRAIQIGLPTPKTESWKYTPITFPIQNFRLSELKENSAKIELYKFIDRLTIEDEIPIYVLNGKVINIIPEMEKTENNPNENYFHKDFFYYLNEATNKEHYHFEFQPNNQTTKIAILVGSIANGDNYLANTNFSFHLHSNCEAEINFYFNNFSKKSFLQNNYFSFTLAPNAKLKINVLEEDPNQLLIINNFYFNLQDNSQLNLFSFAIDGNFTRNNLQVDINGEYCEALLNGLYIGTKKNIVDNHILVNHNKPNSHSNQFFKGILEDKSRGIFNGKIYVKKDAQKTNAYQSNKNILTSPESQIFTKPELEIYADDVKCSHGATSGFLQENEMFYLMTRGINREESKSLLLKAFANEVIEKLNDERYIFWLENKIENLL